MGRPTGVVYVGQNFVWVGQGRVWVGHGLPGLIARTASDDKILRTTSAATNDVARISGLELNPKGDIDRGTRIKDSASPLVSTVTVSKLLS